MKILLLLATLIFGSHGDVLITMKLSQHWDNNFEGIFSVPFKSNIMGWLMKIKFDIPVHDIQIWVGTFLNQSADVTYWVLLNGREKGIFSAGETLEVKMMGKTKGTTAPKATAIFVDLTHANQTLPSLPTNLPQRSGKLPPDNRIPWRKSSTMGDKGDKGEDLSGGWFDAGDYIKFGLPMSSATSFLIWGFLEWKDAYEQCGQLKAILSCIKWPLDYFIKAHTAPHELYVQIGKGGPDYGYWGRPEDTTIARPAFKITESNPGSDVAGQTSAAMTLGSLTFQSIDAKYSATLLKHAKELFEFANNFPGIYRSSGYKDELAWAAIWLYVATKDSKYLKVAEHNHQGGSAWGLSWDDVQAANKNMAFIALMASEMGIMPEPYNKWAMSQIHYPLGDAGRSFVVGFGKNPPTQPHHRSSSCPLRPAPCSWDEQDYKGPDPQVLYGALVGGPDQGDGYMDVRKDYVKNEVACDYNAGFQSAVAGLEHYALISDLPKAT